jgi:hypothetical protein
MAEERQQSGLVGKRLRLALRYRLQRAAQGIRLGRVNE